MQSKKEYGINILKQILTALHEKRFDDVTELVDESTLNAEDLEECVQGTVELNEFNVIDEYMESNIVFIDKEDNEPFTIVSYISADGGNDLPLTLNLELECLDDGTIRTVLDIEPD